MFGGVTAFLKEQDVSVLVLSLSMGVREADRRSFIQGMLLCGVVNKPSG